ncbi:putative type VI secretion system effector [Burkholderia sp. BCC1993]|uniref:putative type VI secretion system effector n=1 Tax=Burkholderia sp. BCC1993 TaxID=2817444 RepID=UPI002AB30C8F|nr:putative type VI secretion system effector [Burkholderia sp. BCC1993]
MSSEREYAVQVLRGTISKLKCRRRQQDFVLNEAQHAYIQATAAGAALAGMGAFAIGLIQSSADSEEEADWVEFELDGKLVEGWLWKMPMKEGDEVEIVAELRPRDRYFAYSVRRISDDVVAVYPHAARGRSALYRWLMKIMLSLFVPIFGLLCILLFRDADGVERTTLVIFLGVTGVAALMIFWILFHRAYMKMRHFAKLAEVIFSCYGWGDVRRINLVRSSKQMKPETRDLEYGIHYFRYRP